MTTKIPFFLLLAATFLLRSVRSQSTTTTDSTHNIQFIRTSCNATLYPDLCYTSLSIYADAIQQSPARLARAAIAVSLKRANHMANFVSNLTKDADYGSDPRAAAALHDCLSNFGDAVDEIRGSLRQIRQAVAPGSESFRFQMSNVQTWMSAALTDEESCTDGFEDVAEGEVKRKVCDRAAEVKKATSNGLALVNSYVEKGSN